MHSCILQVSAHKIEFYREATQAVVSMEQSKNASRKGSSAAGSVQVRGSHLCPSRLWGTLWQEAHMWVVPQQKYAAGEQQYLHFHSTNSVLCLGQLLPPATTEQLPQSSSERSTPPAPAAPAGRGSRQP